MMVAEELDADWSRVTVQQAPGDEVKYGNQDTDGSRSLAPFHPADAPDRRLGAADAGDGRGEEVGRRRRRSGSEATTRWSTRRTGRKLGYGELAEAAMALPTPTRDG